ncbi:MAG: alanine--tRNA ligase-related protein [Nanobdellota archaeon]
MTKTLYLEDCYLKEFETKVSSIKNGKFVTLEKTALYPNSGGQPHDTGKLIRKDDGEVFNVIYVGKFEGIVSHEIDKEGLKENDVVKGEINWERRYTLMRMHTAAHVLSRVLYEETGAHTSGNQLGIEKSRIDFTLENYDKEKIMECIEKANEIIAKEIPVEKKIMDSKEANAIPGFAAPSPHLKQNYEKLRVVDIKDVDIQPCGGTHLNNTKEIGKIEFVKAENKGKKNRRIYYKLA